VNDVLSGLQKYSLWIMLNDINFDNNHNPISINGKPVLENLKK
jgi:hypothetical protein